MTAADLAKAGGIVFLASLAQVSILNSVTLGGGTPDLLLVTLVALALLRGAIFGACAGFFAGLLVDTATLQTLGLTSFLLTVAGYWIGRYGETTGRDRAHAPLVSVCVVTVLYAVGALAVRFVLGESSAARLVLVEALPPTVFLNLLLAIPVYALCQRLLGRSERAAAPAEVRLLG